jgi:hypothetical protein
VESPAQGLFSLISSLPAALSRSQVCWLVDSLMTLHQLKMLFVSVSHEMFNQWQGGLGSGQAFCSIDVLKILRKQLV